MLLSDKVPLQGNVKNYLGKQKTVEAPLHWKSAPDHPKTKLAYITDEEEKILVDLNLYDSMDGKPNTGPHGIPSLNGGGGGSEGAGTNDGGSSGGGSDNNGGYGGFDGTEGTFSTDTSNTGASVGGSENNSNYGGFDGTESANNEGFGSTETGFDGTESYNNQGWGNTENDFNTGAYDYESAAYGPGKITSVDISPTFFGYGEVTIDQTPGVIAAQDYSAASLATKMRDPNMSEKDKVTVLNDIQALLNSSAKGSKLSNKDEEAALFAFNNFSHALSEVKSNPEFDNLTSQIDETKSTLAAQLQEDPFGTIMKEGGLAITVGKSMIESYRLDNALNLLGFTGKVMNKRGYDPKDPSYDPYSNNETYTGGDSGDSGSTLGQLPLQTGGFKPWTGPSAAIGFFAKNPYNVQTLYNNAKQKITGILQAPPSPYGVNAISDSPFYDYLKTFNLNKGIL